jgi:hypothetical protein
MIVYLSNPKHSTRELLNLINNFSKVAGYKINYNKSVALLYSKEKQAEKEIRETTPFTIVTNNINLVNSFSEVAGYKINSNKSVAFLYTKDKQTEKEIRETTAFTIITNNLKYLRVTLTKEVIHLYDKNFKSLKKEFEDDLRSWKDLSRSYIGRVNIVKMGILLEAIYRFNAIPTKIPTQ